MLRKRKREKEREREREREGEGEGERERENEGGNRCTIYLYTVTGACVYARASESRSRVSLVPCLFIIDDDPASVLADFSSPRCPSAREIAIPTRIVPNEEREKDGGR